GRAARRAGRHPARDVAAPPEPDHAARGPVHAFRGGRVVELPLRPGDGVDPHAAGTGIEPRAESGTGSGCDGAGRSIGDPLTRRSLRAHGRTIQVAGSASLRRTLLPVPIRTAGI